MRKAKEKASRPKGQRLRSAVAGTLAGGVCGLFGSGGGMILLPAWTRWARVPDRKAFAGALCVTLPLSLVSLGVYAFQGSVNWGAALPYCIGGLLGGLGGGLLLPRLPTLWLHRGLGAVILYAGFRLVTG